MFYVLFGSHLTLDSIFYFRNITVTNTMGWGNIFIMLACTACMAHVLVYVVERAKKCLDFSFTLFFIHFLFLLDLRRVPGHARVVGHKYLVLHTHDSPWGEIMHERRTKDISLQ